MLGTVFRTCLFGTLSQQPDWHLSLMGEPWNTLPVSSRPRLRTPETPPAFLLSYQGLPPAGFREIIWDREHTHHSLRSERHLPGEIQESHPDSARGPLKNRWVSDWTKTNGRTAGRGTWRWILQCLQSLVDLPQGPVLIKNWPCRAARPILDAARP